MAFLSVDDILQARVLMLASYSVNSSQLENSLSGSQWSPIALVSGETLFYKNPLLLAPVNAFAARSGDTLAVAFQGTDEPIDWLSNFGGGIVSWAPLFAAYSDFFAGLFDYLGSNEGNGVSKIIVTGHSQGAAMVEYFLKEFGADNRYVGVAFASPGIDTNLDYLGSSRLLRIEHTDDIVVDAAQEFGTIGIFIDNEFDLKIHLGEETIINWVAEHGSGIYAATTRILFSSIFAQEILNSYETTRARIGTSAADDLRGSAGRDVIFGLEGADDIFGGGSRDLIDGGDGSDDLRGEGGNDLIYGGGSFDSLYGGTENDELHGGDSYDFLYGEAHNDWLYGDAGNDKLYGGEGNDHLFGGADDDLVNGGEGTDTAHFEDSIENFDLLSDVNGVVIIKAKTGDRGTDTLISIERLEFNDWSGTLGEFRAWWEAKTTTVISGVTESAASSARRPRQLDERCNASFFN